MGRYDMDCAAKAYVNVKVPVRHGTLLATDIYIPNRQRPFPVILCRSPYGAPVFTERSGRRFVGVGQDCRGRFRSGGGFTPWFNEEEDGQDTIEWIAKQPWRDGNIAMIGGPYPGATQLTAALGGHPALKCVTPYVITHDYYDSPYYTGGALQLRLAVRWGLNMIDTQKYSTANYDWTAIERHLPLIDTDEFAGPRLQRWKDLIRNPSYTEYWKKRSLIGRFHQFKAPAFIIGGWFDLYAKQVFDLYNGFKKEAGSEVARRYSRILVGPWAHGVGGRKTGELDFGESAIVNIGEAQSAFIDDFIVAGRKPADDFAPVRIFVMGANVWRDENEWPLARTRWTDCWLGGGGLANSSGGDGVLTFSPPGGDQSPDHFVYDPNDPVPTNGGCNLAETVGPLDQRELEKRFDVLAYTSEPLKEDLEVTGPVSVRLFAASDAPDTDFTAKLVDVYPDGRAIGLCDGVIRARYRQGFETPRRIEPGMALEYAIDLWVTSNVFLAGHRLRLEISSSNFPRFDRNPNTGRVFGMDSEFRVARQTVFHSAIYPSRLVLPVIPSTR